MPTSNLLSIMRSPPKAPLGTIAFLAFLGFADSAYLTADHYLSLPLPCSLAHGCEKVLTSAYSMVGPIPLAFFGVIFYLLVLFTALYLYTSVEVTYRSLYILLVCTVIGLIFSIIFVSMQAFIIHAFCMYCLGSALDTLLLFIAGLWLISSRVRSEGIEPSTLRV